MVNADRRPQTRIEQPRVHVDPALPLAKQAHVGHNRWHPDLAPVLTVGPGEAFTLETIDSSDAYLTQASTTGHVASFPMGRVHPLTGPVAIEGALPGDVLEIEIVEVAPGAFGTAAIGPGEGLLPELLKAPSLTVWDLGPDAAHCPDIDGVTIPAAMFPGTLGVAPSWQEIRSSHARESRGLDADALASELAFADAIPRECADGLRTIPPRRNAGNLDVRELRAGSRLFVEVQTPGAMVSVGDLHYAQGGGELAASAIEMAGAVTMRCRPHRDVAWRGCVPAVLAAPASSRAMMQTIGVGLASYGAHAVDALADAARQAAEAMLEWLRVSRGLSDAHGYIVLSVAADLVISQLVNDPNPVVSVHLPLDIFDPPVDNPLVSSGGM